MISCCFCFIRPLKVDIIKNYKKICIKIEASILDCVSLQAGVGFGVGQSNSDYSADAGISFSF